MTKKDYVKIAAVLQNSQPPKDSTEPPSYWWRRYTTRMADMLAADNPRFDRARFYKACGMES